MPATAHARPLPLATPRLHLRPAQQADAERILDLLEPQEFVKPLTRAQLRALLVYRWTTRRDLGLVLTAGGEIVGYQNLIYSPPRTLDGRTVVTASPGPFFIRDEYRSLGFGRRLLEHLLERAGAAGVSEAFLEVRPSNLAA